MLPSAWRIEYSTSDTEHERRKKETCFVVCVRRTVFPIIGPDCLWFRWRNRCDHHLCESSSVATGVPRQLALPPYLRFGVDPSRFLSEAGCFSPPARCRTPWHCLWDRLRAPNRLGIPLCEMHPFPSPHGYRARQRVRSCGTCSLGLVSINPRCCHRGRARRFLRGHQSIPIEPIVPVLFARLVNGSTLVVGLERTRLVVECGVSPSAAVDHCSLRRSLRLFSLFLDFSG
mmetsp:Transcript_22497/g.50288  ORF Transcript_22497/g.50288 Transcript_22497/m.50288 type:complete len:230 (+) Transcript_22497:38-727(+)